IAEKILDFVSKEKISHVKVFPCYDFPENFTGSVKKEKPDHILLIDSSITGKKPGSIFILNPEGINHEDISSHRIPLRLLYEYLKKETRADIAIIGIEPYYIGKGNKCSKPVEKTINRIVKFLEQLLKNAKIKNEKQ
ncbi:MAG TPA: hydrogenase maturation protease, partial [bacterium]|nr:hydrogenase maturation protease [bacterium]